MYVPDIQLHQPDKNSRRHTVQMHARNQAAMTSWWQEAGAVLSHASSSQPVHVSRPRLVLWTRPGPDKRVPPSQRGRSELLQEYQPSDDSTASSI